MKKETLNKKAKTRIAEAIAFRKECIEKGISLKEAMKERRAKHLNKTTNE